MWGLFFFFFFFLNGQCPPHSAAVNRLTLILISMLSTSFIAHYNAPKFFNELKDRTVLR